MRWSECAVIITETWCNACTPSCECGGVRTGGVRTGGVRTSCEWHV